MEPINVTKAYLPPLAEYTRYLQEIWSRGWITNHGPLSTQLEGTIKEYLGVPHLYAVANGTIALQIAIKALDLKGEIITTPFSYVATTSSIVWENCTPVFVDIDPDTLTIDAAEIEAAITGKTTAIIATHVYGNPCDIEKIDRLAREYKLKVIYDGAHAFGVRYKGTSLFNFGDVSTLSFHATKLFHTAEGGAVVCGDEEIARRISYMRNFGHNGQEDFWGLGINGKMSELHAALGLSIFPEIANLIAKRRQISGWYDLYLFDKATVLKKPRIRDNTEYNYAYYPVIFESENRLLEIRKKMNENNIFPRRYFFPSLNTLNYIKKCRLRHTDFISPRILCLPIHYELTSQETQTISTILLEGLDK